MIEKEIVNTPLKIQGKKTKLIPNIIGLANEIIENNNNIHTWIEPFLGSGIVAFNCPKQIKQVICGDINPHVIRLYEMLRDNKDLPGYARERLLCMSDLLKERGEEYYLSIRNSFNKEKEIINFLFLSRTCFNGMMRFNKKGEWNLPFCKNNDKLSEKLINELYDEMVALQKIMKEKEFLFFCQSYEETLKYADSNSIIYCDPPYYGLNTTYYEKWGKDFEIALNKELNKYPSSKIISTWKTNGSIENEMIPLYWSDYNIKLIEHQYIVGPKKENRPKVIEALLFK